MITLSPPPRDSSSNIRKATRTPPNENMRPRFSAVNGESVELNYPYLLGIARVEGYRSLCHDVSDFSTSVRQIRPLTNQGFPIRKDLAQGLQIVWIASFLSRLGPRGRASDP